MSPLNDRVKKNLPTKAGDSSKLIFQNRLKEIDGNYERMTEI